MTTIEIGKESSEITQITDIKDASKVDLGGAKDLVDKIETGGKKGKEEAMQHIKKGETWAVANYLDNYEGLDNEIADILIKKGELEAVSQKLKKFSGLKFEVANKLIIKGKAKNVAYNINSFDADIHNRIAHALLRYDKNSRTYVLNLLYIFRNLKKFKNLDNGIAKEFLNLKNGFWGMVNVLTNEEIYNLVPTGKFEGSEIVCEHLESFQGLTKGTAIMLMDAGYGVEVAKYINKFEGIDYEFIYNYLIEHGEIEKIIANVKIFKGIGINEIELIDKAVELGVPYDILYKNKDNFSIKGSLYIMNNEYNRTK